jgi:hypothetical protein
LVNLNFDLSQGERQRHLFVRRLIHPGGFLRTLPNDPMVSLAETLSAGEVGLAALVQPRHEVALSVEQQGDHEEAAVAAIRQQNVTRCELIEHFSEQRGLAGLLVFSGSLARVRQ